MPSTYTPIATTTLNSNTTEITFNSISGYTDIVVIMTVKNTTVNFASPRLRFNGDSSSNYSNNIMRGNGSSPSATRQNNDDAISLGNITSTSTAVIIAHINDYATTNKFKSVISRTNNTDDQVSASSGTWRNTAAITSITINAQVNQFSTGSTFTLYGIKAA